MAPFYLDEYEISTDPELIFPGGVGPNTKIYPIIRRPLLYGFNLYYVHDIKKWHKQIVKKLNDEFEYFIRNRDET